MVFRFSVCQVSRSSVFLFYCGCNCIGLLLFSVYVDCVGSQYPPPSPALEYDCVGSQYTNLYWGPTVLVRSTPPHVLRFDGVRSQYTPSVLECDCVGSQYTRLELRFDYVGSQYTPPLPGTGVRWDFCFPSCA